MAAFKPEACTPEQPIVGTRPDKVRTSRPLFPFRRAESEKAVRVGNRLMPWPSQISGDIRIARVSLKNCGCVADRRRRQRESSGCDVSWSLQAASPRFRSPCGGARWKRSLERSLVTQKVSGPAVIDEVTFVFRRSLPRRAGTGSENGLDVIEPELDHPVE